MDWPETGTLLCWCPACGVVVAVDEPKLCRHGLDPTDPGTLPHPPEMLEPIPSWHPYAE